MMNEEAFVRVCDVDDVPAGSLRRVVVGDETVVIANVDGTWYAVSAWCAHQGVSLSYGRLQGHELMCFAHGWTYDVRSGRPVWPPFSGVAAGYCLRTYAVQEEGGALLIAPTSNGGSVG